MSVRALSEPVFHWCAKRAFLGTVAAAALLPLPALADPIPPGWAGFQSRSRRLHRSRRPPGRVQARDQARQERPLVSLRGPFVRSGLEHHRRHRPEESALREIHSLFDDVEGGADSAAHAARRHPDHRHRQGIEDRSDADHLGHQRPRKSEEDRPVEGRRRRLAPQLLSRRQVRLPAGVHAGLSRPRP